MTDIRCLINRCPHAFSLSASFIIQQPDICILYWMDNEENWCSVVHLPVMKMSDSSFFFLSIVKCYIIVFTDWVESASWPCTSVIVRICIFMFLLNGLRQFSQQIPWQTVYFCPVSSLCFQRAVQQPPTICYFCLCGIGWRLWAFNKNLI